MDNFLYFESEMNELDETDLKEYFRLIFKLRQQGYTSFSLNELITMLNEQMMDETYLVSEDILEKLIRTLEYLEGNQMLRRIHENSEVIIYLEFTKEEAENLLTFYTPKTYEEIGLLDTDFPLIQKR